MACFLHALHEFQNVIEGISHIFPRRLHHTFGCGDHVEPSCLRQRPCILQHCLARNISCLLRAPSLKIGAHFTKSCFDSGHEDFLILILHLAQPGLEGELCSCCRTCDLIPHVFVPTLQCQNGFLNGHFIQSTQ